MESEVCNIIACIDSELKAFYHEHDEILSVFVVGSMFNLKDYKLRTNNDYDIRFVVKDITKDIFNAIKSFEERLCEVYTRDDICIKYNNIVGLVNHNLSKKSCNILLHIIVHSIDDLYTTLPLTHQLRYKKYHRFISGKDYLKNLQNNFDINYLIDAYEGILWCQDMLSRNVYKFLELEAKDNESVLSYVYKESSDISEMQHEMIFYSIKNVLLNIYEITVLNRGCDLTFDSFWKSMVMSNEYQKLIMAVVDRNEDLLDNLGIDSRLLAIQYLETIKKNISEGAIG